MARMPAGAEGLKTAKARLAASKCVLGMLNRLSGDGDGWVGCCCLRCGVIFLEAECRMSYGYLVSIEAGLLIEVARIGFKMRRERLQTPQVATSEFKVSMRQIRQGLASDIPT